MGVTLARTPHCTRIHHNEADTGPCAHGRHIDPAQSGGVCAAAIIALLSFVLMIDAHIICVQQTMTNSIIK